MGAHYATNILLTISNTCIANTIGVWVGAMSASEEAIAGRLRRLCEKKPTTGKCKVPDEIHELWKKGGTSREELLKVYAEVGEHKDWNKQS